MRLCPQVAIKIFEPQQMTDKYMKRHFRREAIMLARLSHPCIVGLYEVLEVSAIAGIAGVCVHFEGWRSETVRLIILWRSWDGLELYLHIRCSLDDGLGVLV